MADEKVLKFMEELSGKFDAPREDVDSLKASGASCAGNPNLPGGSLANQARARGTWGLFGQPGTCTGLFPHGSLPPRVSSPSSGDSSSGEEPESEHSEAAARETYASICHKGKGKGKLPGAGPT